MKVFTSADLQRASSEIQRAANSEPVAISVQGRPSYVLMSLEDYHGGNAGPVAVGLTSDQSEDFLDALEVVMDPEGVDRGSSVGL